MPKNEIDYSNTIIYKITCKDSNINDVYVGHTTNFVQRKHAHKQSCINIKSPNYKCKIYEVIRNNGGWDNWSMKIINFFNCRDHYEARQKEQEYFVLLNATLNSIEPMPKPKFKAIKVCEKNDYKCSKQSNIKIENVKTSKNIKKHFCEVCDFSCFKKGDLNRHIMRPKHINLTKSNKNVTENTSININICDICSKEYKSRNGLWNHKKKCKEEIPQSFKQPNNIITTELVMELIKDNKEMKQIILEQNNTINSLVKNGTNNITNSLNNNNNKTFNLQFFLNETCKDAMNIMDFVESIKLQLSDLQKVGEVGYAEGISNIIATNLKALDVTQRPVHCTDKKRETMYIKDENKWEKEDDQNTKLRKIIKRVANKNIRLLPQFREKYPEYSNSSSKISDKYDRMALEAMGGAGDNDKEKEDKIIHNISKCTTIEKYTENN